ncbi:MAG: peptidylprolyl isomerase [Pseudomonadota bacterium]
MRPEEGNQGRGAGALFREPLLWFALLGAGLFWLDARFGEAQFEPVVVNDAIRTRLSEQWRAQMGAPPSSAELKGLIDGWIREEVYAREAEAMGLDRNDTIIRRRLVQKLTFLTEDQATAMPPDEETLQAFYSNEPERYAEPARFDFEHIYFNSDRREDAAADGRALLARLTRSQETVDPASAGDPFMLQRSFARRSERQIGDLFGNAFASALVNAERGPWVGPITSAYGEHLVRIVGVAPARVAPFEEVAARVAIDFGQAERKAASERYYAALRERYPVTVEPTAKAKSPANAQPES